LETGHLTTDPERNSLAGNRQAINGSATYCQTTLPRQSPTLHGRFYRSELYPLLKRVNTYLTRWARRKYKRLRALKRFRRWWQGVMERAPELFVHWKWARAFQWNQMIRAV
ncbi:MAG: hypothetical protein ACRDTH_27575, partial [Pseudonocardiaceae bacterium]